MLIKWHTKIAVQHLLRGNIIAYPTESVWGLGCDPMNKKAVKRLLQLKQRPIDKGLILVAAHISQFDNYLAGLTKQQIKQLNNSWPGFHTWLIPHQGIAPSWISGEHSTVALRVSAHPLVQALCKAFDGPIVSTSANITGKIAATNKLKLHQYFTNKIDYIVPGELGGEQSVSPIIELTTGSTTRI